MNQETKKVLTYMTALWLLTVISFGYNAYRQEIAINSNKIRIEHTMENTIWRSQLMTQEEVKRINEYRNVNPGGNFKEIYSGILVRGSSVGSQLNLTSEEVNIIDISRGGFDNEQEAWEAGFFTKAKEGYEGLKTIDMSKAKEGSFYNIYW